jgi:hypothetical protein
MRTVTFKITPELDRKLSAVAARLGLSRSGALRHALASLGDVGPISFTQAAGHLVGSVSGPRDLSHDPRHLEGYGR